MSRTFTAILADDENRILESLRLKLDRHFPEIRVVACCTNGDIALEAIKQWQPDLLFLDIEMPGKNGLELLQTIRDLGLMVQVIVVSAYEKTEYFRTAIQHAVASYLVKPILLDELREAIAYAIARIPSSEVQKSGHTLPRVFEFSCVHGRVFFTEEQIVYVKAEGNYSRFYLSMGRNELILESLKSLELRFSGTGIFRADRSHFINPRYVFKIVVQSGQCYFVDSVFQEPAELNETGIRNLMRHFHNS